MEKMLLKYKFFNSWFDKSLISLQKSVFPIWIFLNIKKESQKYSLI